MYFVFFFFFSECLILRNLNLFLIFPLANPVEEHLLFVFMLQNHYNILILCTYFLVEYEIAELAIPRMCY